MNYSNILDTIKGWVPEKSKVIDFGCGDGSLLRDLIDTKEINGYGVEIDNQQILSCIEKSIPVIKQDIDEGIHHYENSNFDIAIMADSIQCLKRPDIVLDRILKLSKQCIVTIPNMGYWKCRLDLMSGKMPVTPDLPSSWYKTKNIHLCTIADFENLCKQKNIIIKKKIYINSIKAIPRITNIAPNLFALEGIYLLEKK